MEIDLDKLKGSAQHHISRGDSMQMEPKVIMQLVELASEKQAEPVEFDYPDYHAQGMGCGLEDRGITDRYDAMRYGWDEALDRVAKMLAELGPLYTHPAQPVQPVEPVAYEFPCTGEIVRVEKIEFIESGSKYYKLFRHPPASVVQELVKSLELIEAATLSDRSHEYVKGVARRALKSAKEHGL